MIKISLVLLLGLLPGFTLLLAQADNFQDDIQFFQKQVTKYRNWLEVAGFGQYLRYRELSVDVEQLELKLEFKSSNLDTTIAQWNALKSVFEDDSSINIEEQLYYRAATLFEVPQRNLNVLIKSYGIDGEDHVFSRLIKFRNEGIQVMEENPRRAIEPIYLLPTGVNGGTFSSLIKFQQRLSKENVYECIVDYANQQFKDAGFDGMDPELRILENKNNLRFEVINLRKEVLKDNDLYDWLLKLGFPKGWAKREWLTFLFTHDSTSNGIRLTGDISGKVGNGIQGEVKRGEYLDLEEDYSKELYAYIIEMTSSLRTVLDECNE